MSAAFSPDGKRIVTASADNTARLWDAESGKQIASRSKAIRLRCGARRSAPTASASSPRLTTTRRGCGTPRAASRSAVARRAIRSACGARRSAPTASASSPRLRQDGAAVGRRERQADRASLKGHTAAVWSAAFSPDGKRIVTASDDKTARLWDAESGKQIAVAQRPYRARCGARRSAPTASASSPRLTTTRRGCGTPRAARRSRVAQRPYRARC